MGKKNTFHNIKKALWQSHALAVEATRTSQSQLSSSRQSQHSGVGLGRTVLREKNSMPQWGFKC